MNILLAAMLDKKVEDAVMKFSQLPFNDAILNFNRYDKVLSLLEPLINAYLDLFRALNLISQDEYLKYYKKQLILHHNANGELNDSMNISEDIVKAIEEAISPHLLVSQNTLIHQIKPIYHHYSTSSDLVLLAGVAFIKEKSSEAISLLYQCGIPQSIINLSTYKSEYIVQMLIEYQEDGSLSVPKLAMKYRKNYKQLQKECKTYFGATFHNLFIKIKMLDVLDDLLFTDLSFKEIAFKHDFSGYSNMHRLFNTQYKFPLNHIPRLLYLI
ncbi:helix-turn-helix domain-containing protein [Chryseobacterium sp. 22543]|uniref:AraC family transcriptional regulator n=1 Tax=Chryseobacterium sp. 22543 TaxID=3453940 RepID=UPI003F82F606